MTDKTKKKKKNLALVKGDGHKIYMEPRVGWYFLHTDSFTEEDGMVFLLASFSNYVYSTITRNTRKGGTHDRKAGSAT